MNVPPPSWTILLTGWSLPWMPVIGIVVAAGLYLRGVRIVNEANPRHPIPRARRNCFLAGLAALFMAVGSPIDVYDTSLFWVHMIQHLIMLNVAAPLLMLGAPITVWIRASSSRTRRRVVLPLLRSKPVVILTAPLTCWLLLGPIVLYTTHFTPIFDAALRLDWVHQLEHAMYMFAACLFWWPVVGRDPSRWKLSYPAKLLYLFLAMPALTFLGLALMNATQVIYPSYAVAAATRGWGMSALQDQELAGFIMWVPGSMFVLVAILWTFAQWMKAEQRQGERIDRILDAQRSGR